MKTFNYILLVMLLVQTTIAYAQHPPYLFSYFTGNRDNGGAVRLAISHDGSNYKALNNNLPILDSKQIRSTCGLRDPFILRGEDGNTFYMVLTDMVSANGWDSNRAMVLLKSNDLINWESHVVNIQNKYPGQEDLKRVWAPQVIFDKGYRDRETYTQPEQSIAVVRRRRKQKYLG